jgi:hypothetical protein
MPLPILVALLAKGALTHAATTAAVGAKCAAGAHAAAAGKCAAAAKAGGVHLPPGTPTVARSLAEGDSDKKRR